MKKITFTPDEAGPVDFYIIAQTVYEGKSYILVSEADAGDADAMILRDDSAQEDEEALYSTVTDDREFAALSRIFSEQLDDEDILLET
ncbi:MAG: DUF1292 domain-containing protein [Lachnospiraceae bacterium]|nr:DUF1292 domain-containing protein [Lachnospiraceae bacterium]